MNHRHPLSLDPRPSFGLGWLCDHVRGAVQLPGEAAFEGSCRQWVRQGEPHAVVLAADWTDVEAVRAYAEANGLDIVTVSRDQKATRPNTVVVRRPPRPVSVM